MNLDSTFSLKLLDLETKFNYIYSLELMWVLTWLKKIAKLEPFLFDDVSKIEQNLNKLWLKYIFFEKEEHFDEDKMLFIKWDKETSKYIDLYVSKSENTLNILKDIHLISDIKKKNYLIWKLLWYPDCCIVSFLNYEYKSDLNFNKIIINKTSWAFDWRLNNLINPYSLIPFFPCSYNCKEAIKYAESNLKILWNSEEIKWVFKNYILYNSFWDNKIVDENYYNMKNNNNDIFNFNN